MIYQANWERDFSQGPAKIATMVLAWKEVKRSALKNGGNPSQAAAKKFRDAAWVVVDMNVTETTDESLGGYRSWEHMDNAGNKEESNRRWGEKRGSLPGYIADSKAYIQDMMVSAVDAYRIAAAGKAPIGANIDNWQGVAKPEGYRAPKKVANPVERDVIAADTRDAAVAAGARESSTPVGNPFAMAADPLGRATHAMEDFFAHSNWLVLAQQFKRNGQTQGALSTGTFKLPDQTHALGHKLVHLAEILLGDYALLQKVYNRKEGMAKTKAKTVRTSRNREGDEVTSTTDYYQSAVGDLHTDSWTPVGEMTDLVAATDAVETAVQAGTCDLGDFLVDRSFLQALRHKGEIMMTEGQHEAPETGHAKMASDDLNAAGYSQNQTLAIAANQYVFAPLRAIMDELDPKQARQKLQEQLNRVSWVIAAPYAGHPLLGYIK